MRNKKDIFIGILLICISGSIVRADVFDHPLEQGTMASFVSTTKQLAENPIVKGNFEQEKKISSLGRSLKSSGNFIIALEPGMVWETLKPFPSTLALGKDFIVQSRPGGQKTAISAQGNETFIRLAEVMSAVFSGSTQKLMDNFEIYFHLIAIGTEPGSAWELGLLPRDKAIASFASRITMKGDRAIRSITISEQSGDSISYILLNHSYPSELAPHEKSLFTLP